MSGNLRAYVAIFAITVLTLFGSSSRGADAASTTYAARLGSHGTATLTGTKLAVSVTGLSSGAWSEALYKGTCAKLGSRIVTLAVLTTKGGKATHASTLSTSQATLAVKGVLRVVLGKTVVCGAFVKVVPKPTPTPIAGGKVVLDLANPDSGPVTVDSPKFDVPKNWHIEYEVHCKDAIDAIGGLSIYVFWDEGGENPGASQPLDTTDLHANGPVDSKGSVPIRGGSGTAYLSMISTCAWSIHVVTDLSPAPRPTPTPFVCSGSCLLDVSGSGIQTTDYFNAPSEWRLEWSYDCYSFGIDGNFIVSAYVDGDFLQGGVNELGPRGSGTEYAHNAKGLAYLRVNSECDWDITVWKN